MWQSEQKPGCQLVDSSQPASMHQRVISSKQPAASQQWLAAAAQPASNESLFVHLSVSSLICFRWLAGGCSFWVVVAGSLTATFGWAGWVAGWLPRLLKVGSLAGCWLAGWLVGLLSCWFACWVLCWQVAWAGWCGWLFTC